MNEEIPTGDVARLEGMVAADPGAPAFPALAEALRRAGRPKDGERVARQGLTQRPDAVDGRVALGLALLDLGRLEEARSELARVVARVPDHPLAVSPSTALEDAELPSERLALPAPDADELAAIGEPEIDAAFDGASSVTDDMVSADAVAAQALRAAELDGPEEPNPVLDADFPVATRTVADLLEQQGHTGHADSMRSSLGSDDGDEMIATLERWLENLRRHTR